MNRTERNRVVASLSYYMKLIEAKGYEGLTERQRKRYENLKQDADSIGWKPREKVSAEESIKRNRVNALKHYHEKKTDPEWYEKHKQYSREYYERRKQSSKPSE